MIAKRLKLAIFAAAFASSWQIIDRVLAGLVAAGAGATS